MKPELMWVLRHKETGNYLNDAQGWKFYWQYEDARATARHLSDYELSKVRITVEPVSAKSRKPVKL
jgi:hypothetical protein